MADDIALDTRLRDSARPGRFVTATGWLMVLWCLGFATVNVVYVATNHFADTRYAAYADGLTVMNWIAVALKLVGATIALSAVVDRLRLVPRPVLGGLLWAAFSTLAVYTLVSLGKAVTLALGIGPGEPVDLWDVGYLVFMGAAAAGYGVLAVSYRRRHRQHWMAVVLGGLAAPVVLGGLLVVAPAVLAEVGLMPAS